MATSYLEVWELQQAIGGSKTVREDDYVRAIAAATTQIDRWTGRRFLRDSSASERLFRAESCHRVCVGDFTDPDDVVLETDDVGDGTWSTWDASEWRAEAEDRGNGSFVPLAGEPWRWVSATGTRKFPVYHEPYYWPGSEDYWWGPGAYWRYGEPRFPQDRRLAGPARVRVTTRWGWDTVPTPVSQACLELAILNFQPGNRAPELVGAASLEAAKVLLMDFAVEGGGLYRGPVIA